MSNTNPTKTGCELKCSGRTSSLCCIRHGTLVTNPIISNELKDQLWLPQTEHITGADPGFQVRGGALKKIVPSRGRRQNFWGISCEKSYFSNFRGGRAPGAPPPESAPVLVSMAGNIYFQCKEALKRLKIEFCILLQFDLF